MWDLMEKGGAVMWPLLACSLVALTVILERTLFWLGIARRSDSQLRDEVLGLAQHGGDWTPLAAQLKDCEDYVVAVLKQGILHRDYDMSMAMESEAQHFLKRMSSFMSVPDTIITVAPMLGILGTVTGIMSAFDVLSSTGAADPKLVTGGIAEALITTVAGLIISIATVFPYNHFKSRIEQAGHLMETYATKLEIIRQKLEERQ